MPLNMIVIHRNEHVTNGINNNNLINALYCTFSKLATPEFEKTEILDRFINALTVLYIWQIGNLRIRENNKM